jgi:hypothetical protein
MAISKALTRLGGGPSRCPTRRACRSPCHAKRPSLTAPSTNVSTDHHGRERADAIQVRVSEYQLNDGVLTGEEQQRYRLITTLLTLTTRQPRTWPRSTPSAGRSSQLLTRSKPISAAPESCCAPSPPTASTRKPGDTSRPITRSAGSCTTPHSKPTRSRTDCRSYAASAPSAASPAPSQAFSPRNSSQTHQRAAAEIIAGPLPPQRPAHSSCVLANNVPRPSPCGRLPVCRAPGWPKTQSRSPPPTFTVLWPGYAAPSTPAPMSRRICRPGNVISSAAA